MVETRGRSVIKERDVRNFFFNFIERVLDPHLHGVRNRVISLNRELHRSCCNQNQNQIHYSDFRILPQMILPKHLLRLLMFFPLSALRFERAAI
jgi:hypothetical protein